MKGGGSPICGSIWEEWGDLRVGGFARWRRFVALHLTYHMNLRNRAAHHLLCSLERSRCASCRKE